MKRPAERGILADLERASAVIAERGCALGAPLELFAEATSTNDLAKNAARAGAPHGATFVAETQSAGRGRQGRAWTAVRGESLLVSVVVRVPCSPQRLPLISLASGLSVRDAVAHFTREEPLLKWPNDVLLGGKKVAGVLTESIGMGSDNAAVIVGVGINVFTREFPEAIAGIATSVQSHARAETSVDRAELLGDLLTALDRDIALVAARGLGLVYGRITRFDALAGKQVSGDMGSGVAEGIDVEGRLVVRTADGALARWSAGEVHLSPVA